MAARSSAASLGSKARTGQVLSVFFPALARLAAAVSSAAAATPSDGDVEAASVPVAASAADCGGLVRRGLAACVERCVREHHSFCSRLKHVSLLSLFSIA